MDVLGSVFLAGAAGAAAGFLGSVFLAGAAGAAAGFLGSVFLAGAAGALTGFGIGIAFVTPRVKTYATKVERKIVKARVTN